MHALVGGGGDGSRFFLFSKTLLLTYINYTGDSL
jgi:hypothetical protein